MSLHKIKHNLLFFNYDLSIYTPSSFLQSFFFTFLEYLCILEILTFCCACKFLLIFHFSYPSSNFFYKDVFCKSF